MNQKTALTVFPMHGQVKLAREGYRTRDGHLIEWFGRLLRDKGEVEVVSRPDPLLLRKRYPMTSVAANTIPKDTWLASIPDIRNPKNWWVSSLEKYPEDRMRTAHPVVSWNPFIFLNHAFNENSNKKPIAFDVLDDWSVHHAFREIRKEVSQAYQVAFNAADIITTNSEATLGLAHKYGRLDAIFLPNGVDYENFSTSSKASGPITIGYLGKLGKRLDVNLVRETAENFPEWHFIMAGPIMDREHIRPLKKLGNIDFAGDVHYTKVPEILQTFDIGWVPHLVGSGEVGGDAIKIYEYNASGLPVLSTPIIGAGKRDLRDVYVHKASDHSQFLRQFALDQKRISRINPSSAITHTWSEKARVILHGLGLV